MESLQLTIQMMQQKEAEHKAELNKVYAAVQSIQQGASNATTTKRIKDTPPVYWYAIAKGGSGPNDVGVFTFAEAREKLTGVEGPVWRRVSTEQEGWDFIVDYQEQQLLTVTLPKALPMAVPSAKPAVGKIPEMTAVPVEKWYAVAKGRVPESVGVYNSSAKAALEVEGVSNACFKSFKTEDEAALFLLEYQEQKELTSLQAAVSGMKLPISTNNRTTIAPTGDGEVEKGKSEGKIFDIVYTEETTLRQGLVPHPRSLPSQVQMHLLGQALDVAPLPYSVATGAADSADSGAALSRALATMAGTQSDMELGGEPMDLNWKSGGKISLTSIKTLTQLRERLSELRQGKRAVEQTLLGRISSFLQHAGYEASIANEWAVGSILYRIGCDSQYFYIQLHEHILGQAWEDETSCDFDNAKLEIEHHAAELRRHRTMYSSRIMMICSVYAYLRDQSAGNFRSAKLQEKRQKIQMLAMKKQAAQVESTYQKMKELQSKATNNGQDNNNGRRDKNKPMCWKCHQAGIHTGGKDNCLWKNLSDDEAKAKALEWVAAKQAQIGGQNRG